MNAPLQPPSSGDGQRRSKRIALVLLGTLGVVGGVAAWDAWQKARPAAAPQPSPSPVPTPISAVQTYANNDFIPDVGYYHAPYHSWFPFPFNHYDSSRGYFAGGLWHAVPLVLSMMNSQPSPAAVTSALAARQDAERARPGTSGFAGTRSTSGSSSSSFSRSMPSASPSSTPSSKPSSPPSIQRGGFGGSSHLSGSGGSS